MITWRELLAILQFVEKCDNEKLDKGARLVIDELTWVILPQHMRFYGASENRFSPVQLKLIGEIVRTMNESKEGK